MRVITLAAALACVLLGGCTSFGSRSTAKWPYDDNPCGSSVCDDGHARLAFAKAQAFCRNVFNFYEQGENRAGRGKFALGVIGSLAGSVFAKTAKGSGSEAWAGLSGATNAAQTSIDQSFAGTLDVKRRQAVATAMQTGNSNYWAKNDPGDRVDVAIQMAGACSVASAAADAAAIQALSSGYVAAPANAPLDTAPTPPPAMFYFVPQTPVQQAPVIVPPQAPANPSH